MPKYRRIPDGSDADLMRNWRSRGIKKRQARAKADSDQIDVDGSYISKDTSSGRSSLVGAIRDRLRLTSKNLSVPESNSTERDSATRLIRAARKLQVPEARKNVLRVIRDELRNRNRLDAQDIPF